MQNMDQIRAKKAYLDAEGYSPEDKQFALKIPDMLQTNGLLATWAFLLAKEEKVILTTLHGYLLNQYPDIFKGDNSKSINIQTSLKRFNVWMGSLSTNDLRKLTSEAIEFSGWLKRAVKAYGG